MPLRADLKGSPSEIKKRGWIAISGRLVSPVSRGAVVSGFFLGLVSASVVMISPSRDLALLPCSPPKQAIPRSLIYTLAISGDSLFEFGWMRFWRMSCAQSQWF